MVMTKQYITIQSSCLTDLSQAAKVSAREAILYGRACDWPILHLGQLVGGCGHIEYTRPR